MNEIKQKNSEKNKGQIVNFWRSYRWYILGGFFLLIGFVISKFIKMFVDGKVTANFKVSEFACKDGTAVPVKYYLNLKKLCEALEVIRAELGGRPIYVNSGYRTPSHNKKVGGVPNSQHLTASAADIRILPKKGQTYSQSTKELYELVMRLVKEKKIPTGGVGYYPNSGFVHYDIRGFAGTWIQKENHENDK